MRYPRPLWAEGDPAAWWEAVCAVTREALAGLDVARVAAVGLSGLMHAPVVLDERGAPLAPAMLWMDQRCAAQCAAMNNEAGPLAIGERPFATTVSAPKLRWLAETQPQLLERAAGFVLPKDFLRLRLTGVGGTDASDAGGTGLFDRSTGCWRDAAVGLARVPPRLLPALRDSAALAGGVRGSAARETGLPEGTPVAVGGSDVLCTRLAVGTLGPGDVCLYMGTAAWMSFDGRGFGSTATTGAALRWARDLMGADSYDETIDGADAIEPGAEGLFFLPHLNGERGPTPEPLARGAMVGLTLRHGRAHVARAVLEGTSFQIRRNFDERAPERPRGGVIAGGAARSPLWMQTLVDATGVPLRVPAETETSVLGAAMLGGVAGGLFTLEEGQARMVRPGATYLPDPHLRARYDELYSRYRELDDMLLDWFRKESS